MSYTDLGQPPLDLLRARKSLVTDQQGIEVIQKDLRCCGFNYKNASSVNTHYIQKHSDLPHSDPQTWCMIEIRDIAQHERAKISIPYIPFPTAQPPDSTWTTQLSARIPGSREIRHERRIKLKSRDVNLEEEYETLQAAHEQIQQEHQTVSESNAALQKNLQRHEEEIGRLTARNEDLKRSVRKRQSLLQKTERELDTAEDDCKKYKAMYQQAQSQTSKLASTQILQLITSTFAIVEEWAQSVSTIAFTKWSTLAVEGRSTYSHARFWKQ